MRLKHLPIYAIEGLGLGVFMFLVGLFVVLLESDLFPVPELLPSPLLRRAILGGLVAVTVVAIVYSPWGKRSGAHINPAFTLTFFSMGKIDARDSLGYILFQFLGGIAGIVLAALLFGQHFTDPPINYVVTLPGNPGWPVAFIVEFLLSFGVMLVALAIMNIKPLERWTGYFIAILVAAYITFTAPLSGMSINPARTFASALPAGVWTDIWIYFLAPPLGMLLAARVYLFASKRHPLALNVKFFPHAKTPCIHCIYERGQQALRKSLRQAPQQK